MKKLDALLTALLTFYFAYGSNLDLVQMGDRCPASVTVGAAELPYYRFIINSRGVASIVPDPASSVQGLLWNITKQDERSLSRYEGLKTGVYKKTHVEVNLPDGTKAKAFVFIASDSRPGHARPGYLEKIISGAESCGLPKSYIDRLKDWQH